MTILLRTCLLLSFALFWGGLTFYTGIVVRIMHDVVSDPMTGGMITQQVTVVLQWLGVVTVVLMLANAVVVRKVSSRRFKVLLVCSLLLGLSLAGLFVVHNDLDAVISIKQTEITDRDEFVIGHRRYNRLTTVEWIATFLYLPVIVSVWRLQDRAESVADSRQSHEQ
jgi:hypothetical protein